LKRGRLLSGDDRAGAPRAVVVNDVVAARYFPGRDPIGQRVKVGDAGEPWAVIVGVVGATRNRGLDQEPAPEMFISSFQVPGWNNQMFLMVRTEADPRAVLGSIRAAVKAIDPDQPIYAVRTIEETYQQTQMARRLSVVVFTLFGGVALLIAVVGLYGVVSYATAQRTREIGVRVALGAARSAVTGLFVRQAMVPVLVGAGIGLIAAWAIGLMMASLLFQVKPGDVVTLAGAAFVLIGAGVVASFVPAFGASRVDPVTTLRQD
jgi:ABC-type antimicrobial peptide transport system permease subunit